MWSRTISAFSSDVLAFLQLFEMSPNGKTHVWHVVGEALASKLKKNTGRGVAGQLVMKLEPGGGGSEPHTSVELKLYAFT